MINGIIAFSFSIIAMHISDIFVTELDIFTIPCISGDCVGCARGLGAGEMSV